MIQRHLLCLALLALPVVSGAADSAVIRCDYVRTAKGTDAELWPSNFLIDYEHQAARDIDSGKDFSEVHTTERSVAFIRKLPGHTIGRYSIDRVSGRIEYVESDSGDVLMHVYGVCQANGPRKF